MTPGTYARKTAFHIDPLLAEAVVIEEAHHIRNDEERYATDVGEHKAGMNGERIWRYFE